MSASLIAPASLPTPPLSSADKTPPQRPSDLITPDDSQDSQEDSGKLSGVSPAALCHQRKTRKRKHLLPASVSVSGTAQQQQPPHLALDDSFDLVVASTNNNAASKLPLALHVLNTATHSLSALTRLYTDSAPASTALSRAVDLIAAAHRRRGKLIVCGVGKSGLVGRKLVATLKSLGVGVSFLHAGEAVHGDVGDVRRGDVVLFVSYSGRTEELVRVAKGLDRGTGVVAMLGRVPSPAGPKTGILAALDERVFDEEEDGFSESDNDGDDDGDGVGEREREVRRGGVGVEGEVLVLPAPVHEEEEVSFGVAAPTTSTTVAMAVGDMLALCVADVLFGAGVAEAFQRNHPGGAIGERGKRRRF